MASLREIKDRIGSVRSTLKITSAMKLVASAKLRKAQKAIEALRPYEQTLADILAAVGPAAITPRAAGNYFSDKFAEKPISAPPSATPAHIAAGPQSAEASQPRRPSSLPADAGTGAGGAAPAAAEPSAWDVSAREGKTAVVAIASNSSLCGGFNANVIRKTLETIRGCGGGVEVYPLGRKMAEALRRAGYTADRDYNDLVAHPSYDKSAALARSLAERFEAGELSRVVLVYNRFVSTSTQVPTEETWLPFSQRDEVPNQVRDDAPHRHPRPDRGSQEYLLEPDAEALVAQLLPQVMMLRFHAAILDSAAAEQAARTIAMQTATDNAEDLLGELTLEYNKGRQQKITAEILDLLGGAAE